jgi:hypothetical protein
MEIKYNQNLASTWIHALLEADQFPRQQISFVHDSKCTPVAINVGDWLGHFEETNIILTSLLQAITWPAKDDLVFNAVHVPIFYGFFKEFSVPGSVTRGILTEKDDLIYNQAKKMMISGQEMIDKKFDFTNLPLRR